MTFTRGEIGVRLKDLDGIQDQISNEKIQFQEALSEDFEIDLAEVITQLTARQTTYEATLRVSAQLMQMSLVSYL